MGLQDNLIGNLSIKAVYKKKLPLFSFTGSLDPVRVDLSHDYIQMIQEVMPRSAVTYCDVDYMVCSGKETDEILESLKCGA